MLPQRCRKVRRQLELIQRPFDFPAQFTLVDNPFEKLPDIFQRTLTPHQEVSRVPRVGAIVKVAIVQGVLAELGEDVVDGDLVGHEVDP